MRGITVVRGIIQISGAKKDRTHQWYYLCWLCDQSMRQLLVVFDQVANVDVAVVFLKERILAQLVSAWESANGMDQREHSHCLRIPVHEDVVEPELKDEGLELLLDLEVGVLPFLLGEDVKGMYRPAIHDEV